MATQAGEVRNVGGVVWGQAELANFLRKAQAAVMLHGAGLGGVGLGIESGGRLGIHQQSGHTTHAQFIGQHQATGAAPHNEHRNLNHGRADGGQGGEVANIYWHYFTNHHAGSLMNPSQDVIKPISISTGTTP